MDTFLLKLSAYFEELAAQFTNPLTAIAQILGFIPVVMSFFIFRSNKRTTIIAAKAVSDGISSLHFLLLGEATGCAINCVNIFRGICFSQKDKKPWASGVWIPIAFCSLTVGSSLLGWTGTESFLPMIGSCLAVMGYWCRKTAYLRLFNFIGLSFWIVYGVITFSVPTVVQNLIAVISIAITQLRVSKRKSEETT